MATSFAAYASQYFNKPNNASSTMSSSQPMFFSFTTGDGSRHGGHDTDLDDFDDPHLRESGLGMGASSRRGLEAVDEDPYLRLDEEEDVGRFGFRKAQRQDAPLIARSASPEGSVDSQPGWLAHLVTSPPRRRSPSPVPSEEEEESDGNPPPDILKPPQTIHSLSLTDSLLPRDGSARPLDVFSLPDPRHTSRKRRKYHNASWTAFWLGSVSLCTFFCVLLLFITRKPKEIPSKRLPYTVWLHTVPLVTILTFLSAVAAYAHIWLLRVFVRPVMVATSVFIPATLFVSAVWAFVGSFMWDGDQEPTWGETVGLRLFSIIPLALCLITARGLMHLPRQIHTTSSTLTLTTHLLLANPFLLALSPCILLLMLLGSLPFATLIFRLLLIGYSTRIGPSVIEWHVRAWANWAIVATFGVWLWSWMVARGVMRMTCASVIGAWYFANPADLPPPPTSTHTIHAALVRSTGPSLGTITLSALILTLIRLLSLLTLFLHRLPFYLRRVPWVPFSVPVALYIIPGIRWAVGYLEGATDALSRYVLVYAGLTGGEFWGSARRARVLVGGVEMEGVEEEVEALDGRGPRRQSGQAGQGQRRRVRMKKLGSEPPLTMLTISPLTLTFPFALTTYLFVAHTLGAPNLALGAALLAGIVTALVGLFCVGLVRDAADTLYMCYCIDKTMGERKREEVFIAFEYDGSVPLPLSRQPEQIIPRSPIPQRQQQQPGRSETLFEADAEEQDESEEERERLIAMGVLPPPSKAKSKSKPKPTATTNAKPIQQRRNVPLSPSYLDEGASRFFGLPQPQPHQPLQPQQGRSQPQPQRQEVPEEEEEDDLDPFRRSVVDDLDVEGGLRMGTSPKSPASFGAGHRRVGSAGGGVGSMGLGHAGAVGDGHKRVANEGRERERMMTSAEMNTKSRFLMNLRPFGGDSEEMGSGGSQSQSRLGLGSGLGSAMGMASQSMLEGEREAHGEEKGEGSEDSILGPGSGFFK